MITSPESGRGGSSGFTLIEVLIVVVIIGLLATIAIPRLQDFRNQAHFSGITSDFRNFATVQEHYWQTHATYALDMDDLRFNGTQGVEIQVVEATAMGWSAVGTHMALPSDQGCAVYLGDADPPALPDGTPHNGGPGVVQCAR